MCCQYVAECVLSMVCNASRLLTVKHNFKKWKNIKSYWSWLKLCLLIRPFYYFMEPSLKTFQKNCVVLIAFGLIPPWGIFPKKYRVEVPFSYFCCPKCLVRLVSSLSFEHLIRLFRASIILLCLEANKPEHPYSGQYKPKGQVFNFGICCSMVGVNRLI